MYSHKSFVGFAENYWFPPIIVFIYLFPGFQFAAANSDNILLTFRTRQFPRVIWTGTLLKSPRHFPPLFLMSKLGKQEWSQPVLRFAELATPPEHGSQLEDRTGVQGRVLPWKRPSPYHCFCPFKIRS